MAKKSKPNFKKKEPNSRNNGREEFAEELVANQPNKKNEQQNYKNK
ncbi:hypothetical protein [Bacillus sp. FJAT-22090]|nr:hypothetical protein [Bacillus sp. FJAT-22090]